MPVLVHDGNVIIESNIIMEYVEDAFPDTKRLMPKSAPSKAAVRNLLQRLDTTLHLHIATISVGIAFSTSSSRSIRTIRHSSRTMAVPDPRLQPVTAMSCRPAPAQIVPAGPRWVEAAVCGYEHFASIKRLARWRRYAGGPRLSSVHCRFEHLHMTEVWSRYPALGSWFDRCKQTAGYRNGIAAWLNPKYLELMKERGLATKVNIPAIRATIARQRRRVARPGRGQRQQV